MNQKEKNNKVIAAASTIGMYAILFLLMVFTVAWKAPYPPIPGGQGVSLILGTDDFGSRDVPLTEPAGTQEPEPKEEAPKTEEPREEVKQQEVEPDDREVVTSTEESPVTVKKEEPKKKEEKKEVTKPVEPVKKQEETPRKEETPKTVYTPNKNAGLTDNKTGTTGSKGDDEGKTGDKGDPRGTPTGAVYKGNPGAGGDGKGGSGGGPELNMAGWAWVEMPEAPKTSEEDQYSGQVSFRFEVNEIGEVGKIEKESGNLSFALEQKCREALKKTSFYKTSSGEAPPRTTGTITFKLRVQ